MSSVASGKDPNVANLNRRKLASIICYQDTQSYGGKALGLHFICHGICESSKLLEHEVLLAGNTERI